MFPSRVIIDPKALESNVRWIRARIGDDVSLMAVVKANAYGHGAVAVARIALSNGAEMLAVTNIEEAAELREARIDAPILALSYVPADAIPRAMGLNLMTTVYDDLQIQQYQAVAEGVNSRLGVHVKVDSGMGRLGVALDDAVMLCSRLREMPSLKLEGIYTHFSSAGADPDFTAQQLSRFRQILTQLNEADFRLKHTHAANSAALLTCNDSHFNLVRPGLLLYGLNPLGKSQSLTGLQPAMSWKTTVVQVKTLPDGSAVGYGNTYLTRGNETIATLPVGYADGLRRSPQTWREVLVRGVRAPLVGRVSMEKITINVSHIPNVQIGDEVVLLGKQGVDEISASEIAEWIGSINYEVVTSIAPRVPRTFLKS